MISHNVIRVPYLAHSISNLRDHVRHTLRTMKRVHQILYNPLHNALPLDKKLYTLIVSSANNPASQDDRAPEMALAAVGT